jgi:molybdenum cofactor synthesis domain-containing protein
MLLAVLTISDHCFKGLTADTTGPSVAELAAQQWPHAEILARILPSDEKTIATTLIDLHEQGAALIITAGGTGLKPHDRTPEATRQVIDREAPGLAEAMRALGARTNPYAWLSRAVVGLRGSTIIVNLPGSQRGAEDGLSSLLPLLGRALEVTTSNQKRV